MSDSQEAEKVVELMHCDILGCLHNLHAPKTQITDAIVQALRQQKEKDAVVAETMIGARRREIAQAIRDSDA